jgi:NADPH:quinone reductase
MRAVRVERFGTPAVLEVKAIPDPVARSNEVVVAVRAAAVNPVDVGNVAERVELTRLPRTPGLDFAGVVVEGPERLRGVEVWGTGGNLGMRQDGTHAESVVIPASAVRPKPSRLSMEQAAAVGESYLVAWLALVEAAHLEPGEVVLVIGASGSFGRAATQIAHWKGARVIGANRRPSADAEADVHINTTLQDLREAMLAATEGRGADVALDTVGGAMFEPTLRSLRRRGRHVAISSRGERRVSFDLIDFFHQELRLVGVDSLKVDVTAAGHMLEALREGFETLTLRPPPIKRFALERAVDAYEAVEQGTSGEKVVLVP